jgi:LysM repeat protein
MRSSNAAGLHHLLDGPPRGKSALRTSILVIVLVHTVFFAGLLVQGCRRNQSGNTPRAKDSSVPASQQLAAADHADTLEPTPMEPTNAAPPVPSISRADTNALPPLTPFPPAPGPAAKEYTIMKGDTMFKIARANAVSVNALIKANPKISPSNIKAGQKLRIPAARSAAVESGKAGSAAGNVHVVKAGETLTRIARQNGTTVKALQTANQLSSTRLLVGQKLKIPVSLPSKSLPQSANPVSSPNEPGTISADPSRSGRS